MFLNLSSILGSGHIATHVGQFGLLALKLDVEVLLRRYKFSDWG